jgi:aspartate aminotransferase
MSFFKSVELLPEDPILSLPIYFAADAHPKKVNLGIGAYKDAQGKPAVLSCVRKAEKIIFDQNLNKEYLPIEGNKAYISSLSQLAFGSDLNNKLADRMFAVQTVGGTGGLSIAGDFFFHNLSKTVQLSDPTWPNHRPIFRYAGLNMESYPYYDNQKHDLDFAGMCQAITKMPAGNILVLHGCCHNPSGMDPTQEQWKELSSLIKKQRVLPFFDFAYQGFGNGIEEDAFAVRYFAEQGHEMLVASSCSKNFGLYGERMGMLVIISSDRETIPKVSSQIKQIIRSNYSMPPLHGSRIISTILQNEELTKEWHQELAQMRNRVKEMRQALMEKLKAKNINMDVSFMARQTGLFSFTGLNSDQVQSLRRDYGIYITNNGRANIAGLTWDNIDYVVEAMAKVLKQ